MESPAMYSLIGRRAIVCGSTQGIGRACAAQFAALGAAVTLIARNEGALRGVRDELSTSEGQEHQYICCDFNEPEKLREKVAGHLAETGPVHILLNNTGGPPPGPIVEAEPEAFLRAAKMHLVCNQILAQAVLPGMKEGGYGRIINIISISVKEPIKGLGVSNTARWAVAAWAKTLAGEVARFGITVNNVLPGYTATGRLESLMKVRAKEAGVSEEQMREGMIGQVPAGRLGTPEEIAAAAGFLASPAASYVNGINLPVDGGRCAGL
ncbi:MAG TPA: SDR family oxidoreductase [Phycisphaerae bacterium]|nr:SDR family oxidoreductase [Phycisphaerae bacterium]